MGSLARLECPEEIRCEQQLLVRRGHGGQMVKVVYEDESMHPRPGGDAGRKQDGQVCERLKILVLCKLVKVVDE